MRTLWIIDAGYATSLQQKLKKDIDYLKLKEVLNEKLGEGNEISETYYMTSIAENKDIKQKAFLNWLQQAEPHGPKMRVQTYELKGMNCNCPKCSMEFRRPVQKGVDVGIATLMLKLLSNYDRLILFSGDGDFADAISYIKDQHKEFWAIGLHGSMAGELQSCAEQVIWLDTIMLGDVLSKDTKEIVVPKEKKQENINSEVNKEENRNNGYRKPYNRSSAPRRTYISSRPPYSKHANNEDKPEKEKNDFTERRSKGSKFYEQRKDNFYSRDSFEKRPVGLRPSYRKERTYDEEQPESYESALGVNSLKLQKAKRTYTSQNIKTRSDNYRSPTTPPGGKSNKKNYYSKGEGFSQGYGHTQKSNFNPIKSAEHLKKNKKELD